MELKHKAVVIFFKVDGVPYHTIQGIDQAVSETTAVDQAKSAVMKAITLKQTIECRNVAQEVCYVNLHEANEQSITDARIVEYSADVDL